MILNIEGKEGNLNLGWDSETISLSPSSLAEIKGLEANVKWVVKGAVRTRHYWRWKETCGIYGKALRQKLVHFHNWTPGYGGSREEIEKNNNAMRDWRYRASRIRLYSAFSTCSRLGIFILGALGSRGRASSTQICGNRYKT